MKKVAPALIAGALVEARQHSKNPELTDEVIDRIAWCLAQAMLSEDAKFNIKAFLSTCGVTDVQS